MTSTARLATLSLLREIDRATREALDYERDDTLEGLQTRARLILMLAIDLRIAVSKL